MANGERRDEREWRRLVRAWKRSGRSRAEYAAELGVAPSTLTWWRWRLERARAVAAGGGRDRRAPAIKLVRVEVQDARAAQASPVAAPTAARVAWELQTPNGHTLRVDEGGGESLRSVIGALVPGDGER
jgi:transposase-like protein